eukprot:m.10569 g.10569  ORF g.10569 m.10569 type:complete len:195 (+) comp2536_c0_seq1:2040-2624(+)
MSVGHARFTDYDFAHDLRFQQGLTAIAGRDADTVQRAKAFYFRRFVCPSFSLDDLAHPAASACVCGPAVCTATQPDAGVPRPDHMPESAPAPSAGPAKGAHGPAAEPSHTAVMTSGPAVSEAANGDMRARAGSLDTAESDKWAEDPMLSLAEVMAHIQAGRPVPGCRTVAVSIANEPPSAQTMVRPRKPWESGP